MEILGIKPKPSSFSESRDVLLTIGGTFQVVYTPGNSYLFRSVSNKQKHLGCKKKCEANKNQHLKVLISNKAKKSVNESAT